MKSRDEIVSINGQPVDFVGLERILAASAGKTLIIGVKRQGKLMSLPVTLDPLMVSPHPELGVVFVSETEMKTEQIRELIKRRMAMEEEASKEESCVQAPIERPRQAELAKVRLAKQADEARAGAEQEKAEAERLKVVHAEMARAEAREHAQRVEREKERLTRLAAETRARAEREKAEAEQLREVREELARAEA